MNIKKKWKETLPNMNNLRNSEYKELKKVALEKMLFDLRFWLLSILSCTISMIIIEICNYWGFYFPNYESQFFMILSSLLIGFIGSSIFNKKLNELIGENESGKSTRPDT